MFRKLKNKKNSITIITMIICDFLFLISSAFLFSFSKSSAINSFGTYIANECTKIDSANVTVNFNVERTDIIPFISEIIQYSTVFGNENLSYQRIRPVTNIESDRYISFLDFEESRTCFLMSSTGFSGKTEERINSTFNLKMLLSKTITKNTTSENFVYITDRDAIYLINNNERFSGLKIEELIGKNLNIQYLETGKVCEWVIGNIIISEELNDNVYKNGYGNYVICYSNVQINDHFSYSFDFFNNSFTNNRIIRYLDSTLGINKPSFNNGKLHSLNESELSNYSVKIQNSSSNAFIYSMFVLIIFASFLTMFFFARKATVSPSLLLLMITIPFFFLYSLFFFLVEIIKLSSLFLIFAPSVILSCIILLLFMILAVVLSRRVWKND